MAAVGSSAQPSDQILPRVALVLELGARPIHLAAAEVVDGETLEHITVDMEFTPNDGSAGYSEGYKVNFDVFRAADLTYWSETDFDNRQVQNFGAGSTIVTDNNRDTGQKTWDGWVNDGDLYFVQVRNGARYPVDVKIFVNGYEVSTLAVSQ